MDLTRLTYLYQRYQANLLTEEERREWEIAILDVSKDEAIQGLIDSEWQRAMQDATPFDREAPERICRDIVSHAQHQTRRHRFGYWIRYAAAAVIVVLGVGYLLLHRQTVDSGLHQPSVQEDVLPGGNKALLTLDDGRTIGLSTNHSAIVMGDQITYENGDIVVELAGENYRSEGIQLTVPKGGTYRVTLSDGTKIWLNAESRLNYPARFGSGKRKISLVGEGYFEVAKNSKYSFVVATEQQEIEVLGTQFNVTAYPSETMTKTTLVEGKVKVANVKSGMEYLLKPGQQGIAVGDVTDVKDVTTEQFTAWKDGYFSFDQTPFSEVLEQLARWYNIEIHYRKVPSQTFSGKMKRDARLLSVLDFLAGSGIQFQLDGRKLTIN